MLKRSLFFLVGALLTIGTTVHGQMRSDEQMKNYEQLFGLKNNQAPYPYDVTLIASASPGNVLAPGEQPEFTFLLKNNLKEPIRASGHFDVLAYGTRGIAGDIWLPEMFKIRDLPAIPFEADLPAGGSQVVKIKAELPETFGAYAFIADLGAQGRRFGTSCVRTFAASPEKIQYPKMSLDDSVGADVLKRLGVQAIRMSVAYVPTTDPHYAEEMKKLDAKLQEFADANITVMLMFLSGPYTPEPLDRGRPHLDANDMMLDTKQDLAWAPAYDADFQNFVTAIAEKQGWPKGPVTAVELWNEPWDGISISGWGADIPRFREMYTAMAQGVEKARANGAQVLLGGCDSTSNTFDKLFPDGKDTFLKWLDACTIHYQGITAPVLYRQWLNRQGPNGRVKIWDTESWVANTDDRVATIVAADRAAGYDRSMGVYSGNISTEINKPVVLPDGTKMTPNTHHAWSTAASVGAAQHFIGERPFRELLFKNGLPWVMVFDGPQANPDDGTLVIAGDLREEFGDNLPFRGVRGLAEVAKKEALARQLAALPPDSPDRPALEQQIAKRDILSGGSLTLQNPNHEFTLYDFYGNPLSSKDGVIVVPLDQRGFFLRSNGSAGSLDRLTKAVAAARIEGYEPLNIVAHDLLAPIGTKPSLHLTLTNILNRPVSGAAQIKLGDLKLDVPAKLEFKPNETREVFIPVTEGAARPDNTYPLTFRFDAGADGTASHQENLHVNVIAKKTITVDGNLDDWKDALPQPVRAAGTAGPTLMEAAWLPFTKFSTDQKPGFATGYLAYDDKNLYFAAKVAESAPSPGTLRYEKRNDDAYFYPEVSHEYDPDKTLLKNDYVWQQPIREAGALFLPHSDTKRSFTAWISASRAFAIDFDLPAGKLTKVSFYLLDWDDYKKGRRIVSIEAQDPATGRVLAKTTAREFGFGNYLTFQLAGKVRVIIRSLSWQNAALSGIFLDPSDSKETVHAPAARFLSSDLLTGSHWEGKYGTEGYHVFGSDPSWPADVKVTVPEVVVKKDHTWPEGVRRYSYRKRPDLPFGTSPNTFSNIQLAFNVVPLDQKSDMIPFPPGTMPNFIPHSDTDYEYALNKVADSYGGGTEIWRSYVPGMPRKMFYPRQPASPFDGPVKNGQLVVKYDGNARIVEAALPWTEIPLVKKALDEGRTIKFTFRVNQDSGPGMELAEKRSVSKTNAFTFHPDWVEHWSNEVEFSFGK